MKVLVYAYRDWSFENLRPALDAFQWDRWWLEKGPAPDFSQYDIIVTCEPHIEGWREVWPRVKGKHKVMALQQCHWWQSTVNPGAFWFFDKVMLWSELMREVLNNHGVGDERLYLTGNPRFDHYFSLSAADYGYTLVLGGRSEGVAHYANECGRDHVVFQTHPANHDGKFAPNLDSNMANARRVMFRDAGAGLICMILGKPCRIFPSRKYENYKKSVLYDKPGYGVDPDFVQKATMGPGAIARVQKAITDYAEA